MAQKLQIVYIGEIGNDPDEEGSLAYLAGLERLGLIHLSCVIANRNPALERAQLARGTLDKLGLPGVPVCIGTNYGSRQSNEDTQFGAPYKSTRTVFPKGGDWFWDFLKEVEDRSVAIVCASGLTDMAEMLKRNTKGFTNRFELLRAKVGHVSIMGGVEEQDSVPTLDDLDLLQPTWAATNNGHDWAAAEYAYSMLQRLRIPTVVISKWAAYAASVPRDAYDALAATGHPVGMRLQQMQEAMIQPLWFRANLPGDDPRREGLPPVLGKAWFSKTFCGGKDLSAMDGGGRIWNEILVFNLYDQTAVMAAIPNICNEHFSPVQVKVGIAPSGYALSIIGVNQANHQVRDPANTRAHLVETMLAGLA